MCGTQLSSQQLQGHLIGVAALFRRDRSRRFREHLLLFFRRQRRWDTVVTYRRVVRRPGVVREVRRLGRRNIVVGRGSVGGAGTARRTELPPLSLPLTVATIGRGAPGIGLTAAGLALRRLRLALAGPDESRRLRLA